jgi:hypothetical protein
LNPERRIHSMETLMINSDAFEGCCCPPFVADTYHRLTAAGLQIPLTLEEVENAWKRGPVSSRELALQLKLKCGSELDWEERLLAFARAYQLGKQLQSRVQPMGHTEG